MYNIAIEVWNFGFALIFGGRPQLGFLAKYIPLPVKSARWAD